MLSAGAGKETAVQLECLHKIYVNLNSSIADLLRIDLVYNSK